MASTSKGAATKSTLTPSMTLKGHEHEIRSISYFPDGQQVISGSHDCTARQWDLKTGKEIEEAWDVHKHVVEVAVSRDSRWVVIAGGDFNSGELKVFEVKMGIVKELQGHEARINGIDISVDNTLLASGSWDETARIWNLETGKLVAGPFESEHPVGSVRFSTDSEKLALKSDAGTYLEVWDVESEDFDVSVGDRFDGVDESSYPYTTIFWTNKNKNILTAFTFTENVAAKTIYELDASTLKTVGTPFKGHTENITGLTLSFDGALLVSASDDNTIKLWAFVSRQLLASFDVQNPMALALSPDLRKLAYTTHTEFNSEETWQEFKDHKICICDTPPDILAQAQAHIIPPKKPVRAFIDPLNPDGTRRLVAGCRKQPIYITPAAYPPPTIIPQQPGFVRLSKLLPFSHTNGPAHPVQNDQPRHPLDVPPTLLLPSSLSGQAATQFDHFEIGSSPPRSTRVAQSLRQHLSFFAPKHSLTPPVVEVAPGRKFTRLAAARLPEYKKVDDTRHPSSQQATLPQDNDTSDIDSLPDVHWCKAFLCFYSCWSHGRLRMPPRWRLERVDIPRQDGTTNGSRNGVHGRS